MLRLYNALLFPVRLAAELWYLRHRGGSPREAEAVERTGRRLPPALPRGLWIHGSSVGEAGVVAGLARSVRAARPSTPIALSAFTRTGRARLPGRPLADASFFLPLDFAGLPRRVIGALEPALLSIVETELWPNLLNEARASGLPVLLVNGRLSADRMSRYRRFAGLYRPLLAGLAGVGAQSAEDGERFAELGVPEESIRVTGNVKYDLPTPEVDRTALLSELGIAPDRPVLVAGSTGENEEAPVLEAFTGARAVHPRLFLVLAPRHPERCDDVERLIRSSGLRHERLSRLDPPLEGRTDLLLVDTLGQLARLYGLATLAFVGGSLVPVGGHNVLEPAALGVPVLFGPHTQHFAAPAQALMEAGGARRVEDGVALARALIELLNNDDLRAGAGHNARRVVRRNQGAMARTLDLLLPFLDAGASDLPRGTA